eukprot:g19334.t1
MICRVSYNAVKSFRQGKKAIAGQGVSNLDVDAKELPRENGYPNATEAFAPAYGKDRKNGNSFGYVPAVSAEDEANDESCIPWGPAAPVIKAAEPSGQAPCPLRDNDNAWIEEIRRDISSRNRDDLRILGEIQGLGDKIDNMPLEGLYDKMRDAILSLLEYQQNPGYRNAEQTLNLAEEAARSVCNNERSLVLSLSALRLRVVIAYIHHSKHSQGMEPSMDDKEQDKKQCHIYITNALNQAPLKALCRKFLAARDDRDKRERERVELEAVIAFDIILEVVSSVYLVEPFTPSEGPLPKKVPDIVLHALSAYCESELGSSLIYTDLARALKDWESTPQRKEKWALYCLFRSTNGPAWACSEGWDTLFESDLSSLYGVSTDKGRVTKISLGANNLEGRLPKQLENLDRLEELSLPGNELVGKVPKQLWTLPCLRVVALHGNSFSVIPPGTFKPAAACIGASSGRGLLKPEGRPQEPDKRRRHGVAGKVELRGSARLEVYKGEWFACSWNITNTGGIVFAKGTKLSKGDEHSYIRGPVEVVVNPLAPGEEQVVTVMQQAPDHDAWEIRDKWSLVGHGLDFVDDDEAKAQTPEVTVVDRPVAGKKWDDDENKQTLANTVFVAADGRRRRGSSQHFSSSSLPSYPFPLRPGAHASSDAPR